MNLQGADELRARFKALQKGVFKPAAKDWATEALKIAQDSVPNRNTRWSKGRLHDSFKVRMNTAKTVSKARVVGHYTGYFVDAGVKPHSLIRRKARPKGGAGRTIFAAAARKRHPGYPARPYRHRMLVVAYRKHPALDYAIKAWNEAA